eukprot:7875992-Pyramimonas_sp.AAC.1
MEEAPFKFTTDPQHGTVETFAVNRLRHGVLSIVRLWVIDKSKAIHAPGRLSNALPTNPGINVP